MERSGAPSFVWGKNWLSANRAERARMSIVQRWFRLLGTVALGITLSACRVDANVDVVVETNGSGSVTVAVTADQEVVDEAPSLTSDLRLDDLRAAGWEVTGPTPAEGGGLQLTVVHPFATVDEANQILAQLSGANGPLKDVAIMQRRAFAKVTTRVSGQITTAAGIAMFSDNDLVAQIGGPLPYQADLDSRGLPLDRVLGLRFSVTVPGRAELSDGFASPTVGSGFDARTTVDWTAEVTGAAATPAGQSIRLEARIEDATARRADRLREFAPWALASWGALFCLVILPIAYLVRRRRKLRNARS
jgi:hypothetical protein